MMPEISLTNREVLLATLARLALISLGEPVRFTELTGGISSTILKIEIPGKTFCIKQALPSLKVAGQWNAPIDRIYAEIAWLQLAASIVPASVPQVLGTDTQTHSFAMSFLPPDRFHNWKSELLAGNVSLAFTAQVATALAVIHGATSRRADLKAQFANDENFLALRLDPYLLETARRHPDLSPQLKEIVHRTQTTKLALVHGDVSPKNILIGPSGPVFLDAECAWYGDPAFDAAFCLNHLLLKSAARRNFSASLLESFDTFVEAYLQNVAWEPRSEIEARIAALLPALALARVSGKSTLEYLDGTTSQSVVNTTHPLIAHPVSKLEAVKRAWKAGFRLE